MLVLNMSNIDVTRIAIKIISDAQKPRYTTRGCVKIKPIKPPPKPLRVILIEVIPGAVSCSKAWLLKINNPRPT